MDNAPRPGSPDLPYGTPSPGNTDFMNLTVEQRRALQTVERVGASLSLVGVCLVFVSFAAFKRLRTVPNTFILFASIANVGASVACLIGYDGLNAGDDSALCQIQGFLLEMFMQSDPWWSLAMAINVYMVFFLAANPTSFRQYLWVYCLICFGAPAVPALILLTIRNDPRGPVYGNATLWCWIGDSWNSLRIFTYYIPIWVCIMLSAIIYFAVGYQVFHQRNQLRNLTLSNQAKDTSSSDVRESGERTTANTTPYTNQPGCYGLVTTEVHVTATVTAPASLTSSHSHETPPSTPTPSIAPVLPCKPATHHGHHPWASSGPPGDFYNDTDSSDLENNVCAPSSSFSPRTTKTTTATTAPTTTFNISTPYTTPSTTFRPRPHHSRRPPPIPPPSRSILTRLRSGTSHFLQKLSNLDPIKLAYLRTSFIFAVSILITWAPSSINRVYTLIYPSRFNFGLNMASAVVLPLQGLWNCVIFCGASWRVLRDELEGVWGRCGFGTGVGERERGFELGTTTAGRMSNVRVVRGGSF